MGKIPRSKLTCALSQRKLSSRIAIVRNRAYVFIDCPIKNIIVLEAFPYKQIPENLTEVGVVRLVVKPQWASVVEVDGKLIRETTTKNLGWGGHFLFHDTVVLLLFCSCFQSLPRERSAAEIKHNIPKRFHIITARLFCDTLAASLQSRGKLYTYQLPSVCW